MTLDQVCMPAWVAWLSVLQGLALLIASLILMSTSLAVLRSFRRMVRDMRAAGGWRAASATNSDKQGAA